MGARIMGRLGMATLMMVLAALPALAQPATPVGLKIKAYGVFEMATPDAGSWPPTGDGVLQSRVLAPPPARTTLVPLKNGLTFGLSFVVTGRDDAPPVQLRVVVDGPGLAGDKSGRDRYATTRLTATAGQTYHALVKLGPRDRPGLYRIRVFYRNKLLGGREFSVKK